MFKKIEAKLLDMLFMKWVSNEYASEQIKGIMDEVREQLMFERDQVMEEIEAKRSERTVIMGFNYSNKK